MKEKILSYIPLIVAIVVATVVGSLIGAVVILQTQGKLSSFLASLSYTAPEVKESISESTSEPIQEILPEETTIENPGEESTNTQQEFQEQRQPQQQPQQPQPQPQQQPQKQQQAEINESNTCKTGLTAFLDSLQKENEIIDDFSNTMVNNLNHRINKLDALIVANETKYGSYDFMRDFVTYFNASYQRDIDMTKSLRDGFQNYKVGVSKIQDILNRELAYFKSLPSTSIVDQTNCLIRLNKYKEIDNNINKVVDLLIQEAGFSAKAVNEMTDLHLEDLGRLNQHLGSPPPEPTHYHNIFYGTDSGLNSMKKWVAEEQFKLQMDSLRLEIRRIADALTY